MPTRKYKTDKKQLLDIIKSIVNSTDESKFQHKVELVNIVLGGMPPSELCKYVSESKNTITSWVKIVDEEGFEALRARKQTGHPTKLTTEENDQIISILTENKPQYYGYNAWNGASLSSYIKNTYAKDLSERHCQRLIKKIKDSSRTQNQKRRMIPQKPITTYIK